MATDETREIHPDNWLTVDESDVFRGELTIGEEEEEEETGPVRTIEEWQDIETLRICNANIAEMHSVLATMPGHKRGTQWHRDRYDALMDMMRFRRMLEDRLNRLGL